jgi:hypothetical protein
LGLAIKTLGSLAPAGRKDVEQMLIQRIYSPTDEEILFHYCSADSFHAILESGTIRFTDINMLNDTAEMHWGCSVFEEAAGKLLRGVLGGTDEVVAGENVRFRIRDNALIASLDISFRRVFKFSAVKRICLGPNNPNWFGNVFYFAGSLNYENMVVAKSKSTYR